MSHRIAAKRAQGATQLEALELRRLLSGSAAVAYLDSAMDEYAMQTDVYTDHGSAGNHFPVVARISSTGDESAVGALNDAWSDSPRSGHTAIACAFDSRGANWGGYIFMNGALSKKAASPSQNWGTVPQAGLNLVGATQMAFWVKGAVGGEKVEFFCLGVGRSAETGDPVSPYPDSSPKASTGVITLSTQWQKFTIDLTGSDLSYVLGGFGWVATSADNNSANIHFYLDDIQFNQPRQTQPHFLVSYETQGTNLPFDKVMKSTAYVYDQDVALLAFLAGGDNVRAKGIADALVYASSHDPFYTDGRLRNAYQGGDLILPPGWTPNGRKGAARTAGWFDVASGKYKTDASQMGTSTGTMAWSMLSLLRYYQAAGGTRYLSTATTMGKWVAKNCLDNRGAGGFVAGFVGAEPTPQKLTYKSTEHNITLYSAYTLLYRITKASVWRTYAKAAQGFVNAMWDKTQKKFWTGTLADGRTVNHDVIPVEVQALGVLALGKATPAYRAALTYADRKLKVGNGYDFNQDLDGVWMEGTGMMAEAYKATRAAAKAQLLVDYLQSTQAADGGIVAASKNGLTTGFVASKDTPWNYFSRKSISATAWMELAADGINPLAV